MPGLPIYPILHEQTMLLRVVRQSVFTPHGLGSQGLDEFNPASVLINDKMDSSATKLKILGKNFDAQSSTLPCKIPI